MHQIWRHDPRYPDGSASSPTARHNLVIGAGARASPPASTLRMEAASDFISSRDERVELVGV